jgi:alpha-beta hydrolase superfamily lysophospholipase
LTPQQLRALREGLPAFAAAETVSPQQREFCRFYGIDFQDRLPGVEYRVGAVSSGAYTVAVHRWLQAGASCNLLLVHGYFDHSGLFGKLIEFGLSRNCNVVIFDLPGHGLSSGEPASIDDFAEYGRATHAVIEAVQLPPLSLWVMAQSTGCAALVEYARRYSWPFAATVLLAPLVRPFGWRWGRLAHSLVQPFAGSIERTFAPNSTDKEFLRFLRLDPLQSQRLPVRWVTALRRWIDSLPEKDLGVGPALIVQGDADRTVDWRYNVDFYRGLFPGSSVKMEPGAGHQLANESTAIREHYLGIVESYLQGLGLPMSTGIRNNNQLT